MLTMRKQIVRQNAISMCPDLTLETDNISDSKDHDPQRQETQTQRQGLTAAPKESQNVKLSPTKITSVDKERLLNRCNKKLKRYEKQLLEKRNKEKIYFHHDTLWKKNASQHQDNQLVTGKRDSSDGLPVDSGVLTETLSLKNNKEHLTAEEKPTQSKNGHGFFLDASQELKKSPRSTNLCSSSGDEGFVNGDAKKCPSLSLDLNDIPEDGACAVPKLKLNDEDKSISLTGKKKGDGFRRSSGYGTGGSEEAPDDEYNSNLSVFERSFSNNDTKPISGTELPLDGEQVSNTAGVVTELSDQIEEALGRRPSSTNGQRLVELKDTSLPPDARIWDFTQSITIRSDVKRKYEDGVIGELSPSEIAKDLSNIMRDNQQIRMPKMRDCLQRSADSDELFDSDDVCEEIGPLRSQDSLTDDEFDEDIDLLLSEASVLAEVSNGRRSERDVNGCFGGFDEVDGARCSTPEVKRLSQCLERAVFCKKLRGSCEDPLCVKGQMHICHLKDLIQKGRLRECNPNILPFLSSHIKECTEFQCVVPLCDSIRQRSSLEHPIQLMLGQSLQPKTNKLAVLTQRVLQNGNFHILDNDRSDGYALWKSAKVQYVSPMGGFCDSNILRVCLRLMTQSGASDKVHVVIKKALQTGRNEKNVYLAIKKPSPYLVRSFWYSELKDDTMLVCSVYHTDSDFMELETLLFHDTTLDLCRAILRQAAEAAKYLHSLNVVYLSWKCSGLLLDKRNQSVKLCNFSHAMVLEQGVVVTSPDNIRSTIDPCYAAPEVLCDDKALGFYSDVWGLGYLLYELLHKSKPFPDYCHRSPADIRRMVCQKEFHPPYPELQMDIFTHCWQPVSAQRITIDNLLDLLADPTDVDR
ncbi:uncharacterized protein [Asterias amurensis]|uniref:uncharacterized protein n=1 Tax=Asterias amurensis TaxID=7602 RepID=UPI003AB26B24